MGMILAFLLLHGMAVVTAVCSGLLTAIVLSAWTHEVPSGSDWQDECVAVAAVLVSTLVPWLIAGLAFWAQRFGPLAAHPDVMQAVGFGVVVSAIPAFCSCTMRTRYGERLLARIQGRSREFTA